MITPFADIQVIIWDFDGTLYKPNEELWHAVREGEYRTIMNHRNWNHEKTVGEFNKIYKHMFTSATQTAAYLSRLTVSEAAIEMERYFDRRQFLSRDERLIQLFTKLTKYRHFILANGVIENHKKTLEKLGLLPSLFEEFVTSETVGITKPDPAGFTYILHKTKLPASRHLMIGDRVNIDLVPAKNLGMKTCLVWSRQDDTIADSTLPVVYDVEKILT